MTIAEAISVALEGQIQGMTIHEIYDVIIQKNLYTFSTATPLTVVNATVRKHCAGLDFPSASKVKLFEIVDYQGKSIKYALIDTEREKEAGHRKARKSASTGLLPEEKISAAYQEHISMMQMTLMDSIMAHSPDFFEQLVVDLLISMGYGYDAASGAVVGKPHDRGIDGVIYQDKLGLDKIYLQAKRYKAGNTVGSKELQAFVGAMQNVQKGVFITTSKFTKEALAYARNQQQKNLKLIDGSELTELMIRYEVGVVRAADPIVLYKIDDSYFG